jgi:two-component system catabolic regulation response regulator CreB
MQTILIVEDEPTIMENIRYALTTEGFSVECSTTGTDALAVLAIKSIDFLIVDVGLPDMTGFDLCRTIRKNKTIPILFLTARSGEVDRVVGLEIGGDDYLTKPFSPREMVARVRAILRRTRPASSNTNKSGIQIHEAEYRATFNSQPIELTLSEFLILKAFVNSPNRVFTREHLMNRISDEPQMTLERTIDSHIKSLRGKLKLAGSDPELIVTHRGIGYSFKNDQ